MAVNDGFSPTRDPFPGIDTGIPSAPGSPGVTNQTAGPLVGSPVVSNPYASAQVPSNVPVQAVYAGDTSSMSDDLPVHPDALNGQQDAAAMLTTGAGGGRARVDSSGRYSWQQSPGGA